MKYLTPNQCIQVTGGNVSIDGFHVSTKGLSNPCIADIQSMLQLLADKKMTLSLFESKMETTPCTEKDGTLLFAHVLHSLADTIIKNA